MSGEDTNVRCNDTIASGGHLCDWKTLISKLHILYHINIKLLVLFDLFLSIPSTIFQLNRDGSSWVEPVLS